MLKKIIKICVSILVFFFYFKVAFAQVVINEIMYDLPKDSGSDIGREWIEVFNNGSKDVDLSGWRFYEAKTNHRLKLFKGNSVLHAGGYAIIADNPEKFLVDNVGFAGTIFDSSFSLKNTGEAIALRDSSLVDIDSVTYSSKQGAKGDGNSLQKINNSWAAYSPTPDHVNLGVPLSSGQGSVLPILIQVKKPQSSVLINNRLLPIDPQIFTYIKVLSKIVVVGADILLKGEALGLEKRPLPRARYVWTLGDGGTKEGQSILYHYNYTGKYVVILNASSGKYSASDRVIMDVIPEDIEISSVGTGSDSFVELYNKTKYEINLSLWQLRAGSKNFIIPKDTIILPKSKIIFSPQNTKFMIIKNQKIELLYSNGFLARIFTWGLDPQMKVSRAVSVSSNSIQSRTLDRLKLKTPVRVSIVQNVKKAKAKVKTKVLLGKEKVMLNTNNIAGKNQSANVFTVPNNKGTYRWTLGLLGILSVAIFGVFLIRKEKYSKESPSSNQKDTDADEYEIIEE